MTQSIDTITRSIRFSRPMYDDIKARAEANKRSVQDEVIFLLEQALGSQTPTPNATPLAPPTRPSTPENNQTVNHLLAVAIELLNRGKNTIVGLA